MSFNGFVCPTDKGWYDSLFASQPLDEVNFWRPKATRPFRALEYGEPLIFKLKRQYGDKIVGFGFFVGQYTMTLKEAWALFAEQNGVASLHELRERVTKYTRYDHASQAPLDHPIGALLLTTPVFFPESLWVDGPSDWKPQIVSGKGYDLTQGEGRRIWRDCYEIACGLQFERSTELNLERGERARRGEPVLTAPRLGQSTFRMAVRKAYAQCAVSREHTLPALDAAHIMPFASDGPHTISNGLLLRADIHRLFDEGYVSVSTDYKFQVSGALDEEFGNGKIYYAMHDDPIILPERHDQWPEREYLEHHQSHVFRGV